MYRMTSNRGEKETLVIGAAAAAIFFLLAVNTSGAVNDMEAVAGPDAPSLQYSSFLFHYADTTATTSTTVGENNNDVTFHLQGNHAENTVDEVLAAVGYDMTAFERFSNGTIVVTATRVFDYNNNDNNNKNTPMTNNWSLEMRVNQKE
jgi:membrane-anchored protein YejM (alkaline phosphatase superfamily)